MISRPARTEEALDCIKCGAELRRFTFAFPDDVRPRSRPVCPVCSPDRAAAFEALEKEFGAPERMRVCASQGCEDPALPGLRFCRQCQEDQNESTISGLALAAAVCGLVGCGLMLLAVVRIGLGLLGVW